MIVVVFEVWPNPERKGEYLDLAAELRVAGVMRDYALKDREQAPDDSRHAHPSP